MRSKTAFGVCAAGLALAAVGAMGLDNEGQAFVLEYVITAIGLAITGVGVRFAPAQKRGDNSNDN